MPEPITAPPAAPPAARGPSKFMQSFMEEMKQSQVQPPETVSTDAAVPNPPPTPEPPAPAPVPPPVEPPPQAKAEPEPKPATPPAPEEKWPRSSGDWKAYKEANAKRMKAVEDEREAVRKELEETKRQIEELRGKGPSPELESLKKERDEYSNIIRALEVTAHPKFKAYFDGKINTVIEQGKRAVGNERGSRFEEIAKLPDGVFRDSQIEEFIADLPQFKQFQVGNAFNELTRIEQERQSEIANARENYQQMMESRKVQQEKAATEAKAKGEQAFNDVVKRAQAQDGFYVFQNRDGDNEWNEAVRGRIEDARKLAFGLADPKQISLAALQAVAVPALLKDFQAVSQERDALKAQVAAMSAATPAPKTAEPRGDMPANPPAERPKPGMRPRDATAAWMKGLPPLTQ